KLFGALIDVLLQRAKQFELGQLRNAIPFRTTGTTRSVAATALAAGALESLLLFLKCGQQLVEIVAGFALQFQRLLVGRLLDCGIELTVEPFVSLGDALLDAFSGLLHRLA